MPDRPGSPADPVTPRVALIWDDALLEGAGAARLPAARLRCAHRLMSLCGALHWREVQLAPLDRALGDPATLATFHEPDFLATLFAEQSGAWAGLAVAAARSAVRAAGELAPRVLSMAGGMAQAAPDGAHGEGLLNDTLLAVRDARERWGRVAVVSLAAEQPSALARALAGDEGLLLLSLHESGAYLPTNGAAGAPMLSLPLPPGAGDADLETGWERLVAPLLARFQPAGIILLGGPSAHVAEPLAHLRLTTEGYGRFVGWLADSAPRFVLLGGGGSLALVAARMWTVALAVLAGRSSALPTLLPPALGEGVQPLRDEPLPRLPSDWRIFVEQRLGESLAQAQQPLFARWGIPLAEGGSAPATPIDEPPAQEAAMHWPGLDEALSNTTLAALPSPSQEELPPPGEPHRATRSQQPRAGAGRQGARRARRRPVREAAPRPERDDSPPAASPPPTPAASDGASRKRRRRKKRGRKGE